LRRPHDPQGVPFTQLRAKEFAGKPHLIIICGHYEGVDERVREALVDEEVVSAITCLLTVRSLQR